jgi:hypothetical protein
MEASVTRKSLLGPNCKAAVAVVFCVATCAVGSLLIGRPTTKPGTPLAPRAVHASETVVADDPSAWDRLSDVQRSTLLPLKALWSDLDQSNRQRWLEVAGHMQRLSPQARGRAQVHMADWAKLSPQERAEARLHYVNAKRLPAGKRNERWSQYQLGPKSTLARGGAETQLSMVAPATVRAAPGATTILLNQLPWAGTVEVDPDDAPAAPG